MFETYGRPPDPKRPLVCLDEFCKELIADTRQAQLALPGFAARMDYEYERRGMCGVFMVHAPHQCWRDVRVTGQRTVRHWAATIKWLCDEVFPDAEQIVLLQDNLNTHTPASLYEAFDPAEALRLKQRIAWHYTPKHGGWLNMAEIEIGVAQQQYLDRRIADQSTLEHELIAWRDKRNAAHCGTDWQFKTADARTKLKRLYPSTLLT
ncbi:MAG: transposase [Verrucomicrobiaceae bacterium]|nr:transposase [Verrucomicrobiaceae bacterium]